MSWRSTDKKYSFHLVTEYKVCIRLMLLSLFLFAFFSNFWLGGWEPISEITIENFPVLLLQPLCPTSTYVGHLMLLLNSRHFTLSVSFSSPPPTLSPLSILLSYYAGYHQNEQLSRFGNRLRVTLYHPRYGNRVE